MAQLKDTIVTGDLSVTGTIWGDVPLDDLTGADDLKAIEALTGTSGILTKTAANTWSLSSGATPASHAHGNITNAGAIGTAANKGVYTGTNGVLTAGTIPVAAGGTGAASFTANSVVISGSSTTAALTTRPITNITAKGDLGWTSALGPNIPTLNTLAYWNGRYSSTASNLQYCTKGEFGNAVTYGVDDATANGALGTGTGLTTERSVYYGLVTVNNASQTRATGIYAPTSAGTAGYILKSSGGTAAPVWLQTLPVANGGTGATTFTSGNVLVGAGTNAITTIAKTNANTANTLVQRDGSGNFSAGTITATLNGTATTATKLGTATVGSANRGIYLNAGTPTALTWYPNYVGVNSGNTNNYPWHRVATVNLGTGSWVDKDAILSIRSRYNGGKYGIVKISARANNATTNPKQSVDISAGWIVRYAFAVGDIRIAKKGLSGESAQVDVYVKCNAYMRAIAYLEEGSNNGWSLIASTEVSDTTASDKKTSVEVWADITTSQGAITYDTVKDATDIGIVSQAESAALRTYKAYNTNVELPLIGGSTGSTSPAAPTGETGSSDLYGQIPKTTANRATYNLSTGLITVPSGIQTNDPISVTNGTTLESKVVTSNPNGSVGLSVYNSRGVWDYSDEKWMVYSEQGINKPTKTTSYSGADFGIRNIATGSDEPTGGNDGDVYIQYTEGNTLSSIIDIIYPVGSIYMSVNNTNPAILFGGTWERITGRFLLGWQSGWTLGEAAGSASNSHSHTEGNLAAAVGASGNNIYALSYQAGSLNSRGPSTTGQYTLGASSSTSSAYTYNHHTRVYGTTASTSVTHWPPYLIVCIWKRVS